MYVRPLNESLISTLRATSALVPQPPHVDTTTDHPGPFSGKPFYIATGLTSAVVVPTVINMAKEEFGMFGAVGMGVIFGGLVSALVGTFIAGAFRD